MRILILLFLSAGITQYETESTSPNGKYKLSMLAIEEGDANKKYVYTLISIKTGSKAEIVNCTRHDLGKPNHYWDKKSRFIVVEVTGETTDPRIRIIDLASGKTEVELQGVIGNADKDSNQFDSKHNILIYFNTANRKSPNIPDLYAFNIDSKKYTKLFSLIPGWIWSFLK